MQVQKSVVSLSTLGLGLLLLAGAGCVNTNEVRVDVPKLMPQVSTTTQNEVMPSSTNSGSAMVDSPAGTEDMKFSLNGKNFAFSMDGKEAPELRVKQGDKVRIEFTSESGFHDWKVDEFAAATKQVQTGGKTSVEFVATKKGTFEYYCSVGKHRQMGMKGNLTVE